MTHQLVFKKFRSSDFEEYFRLVSNENVMEMVTGRAMTLDEAKTKFERLIEVNEKFEDYGTYKVYDQNSNQFIGLGKLVLHEENHDEAELGYLLLPEYWGKGYGSKIASTLMDQARNLGIHRVVAIIDPNNAASKKILLKNGFVTEKVCEMDGLPGEILASNLRSSG